MFVYRYLFPSFDPNKCKLYLRSAIIRIKLHKSKCEENIKRQRREILKLIDDDNEDMAQIQVEQILRAEKMIEAYDILELFCELLQAKMGVLELTDDIPHDLREAACSIIWASLRVGVPEVAQIVQQFKLKFGEEFVKHAVENHNDVVNGQLMAKLTIEIPDPELVQDYLLELSPVPDSGPSFKDVSAGDPPEESSAASHPIGDFPPPTVGGQPWGLDIPQFAPETSPPPVDPTAPPCHLNPTPPVAGSGVDLDALAARFEQLKRGL